MEYRLTKKQLLEILEGWNHYLKRKVHLIACGGTAMTLLGVKASTKDVDFMTPEVDEHTYLIKQIKKLGFTTRKLRIQDGSGRASRSDLIFSVGTGFTQRSYCSRPLKRASIPG